MIQKMLAWPLCQDDTQIREVLHINQTNKRMNEGEQSIASTRVRKDSLSGKGTKIWMYYDQIYQFASW